MSYPPLNALRVFEAVARHGNFSRAADELCVTQSAVSHQVRHLEQWIGTPLFERHGNRAELLDHAAELSLGLASAFAEIDALCRKARKAARPDTLTIAVIPSVAVCWLIPRLSQFRKRRPDIEIRILYAIHGKEIDFRDVDLAVVFAAKPPRIPGVNVEHFLPGASAPVCSRAFADRQGPLACDREIARAGLLHDTDMSGWQEWMEHADVADAVPQGPVFEDFNLLRAATLAGEGVALCPVAIIQDDIAAGHLIRLSERTVRDDFAYYLLTRTNTGSGRAKAASAFGDWLIGTTLQTLS